MYPDDSILIARGKYSTLSKERRAQLERVQGIASTLITSAQAALRDCEAQPPVSLMPIANIEACLKNLKDSRDRLVVLCAEMAELKPIAWAK